MVESARIPAHDDRKVARNEVKRTPNRRKLNLRYPPATPNSGSHRLAPRSEFAVSKRPFTLTMSRSGQAKRKWRRVNQKVEVNVNLLLHFPSPTLLSPLPATCSSSSALHLERLRALPHPFHRLPPLRPINIQECQLHRKSC